MKSQNAYFNLVASLILSAPLLLIQHAHSGTGGAMMGAVPDARMAMMQEPNKAMAQASVLYMTVFTQSLHLQATERRDKIDNPFIKAAFAEMKRAHGMIEAFQTAHVKTMDAEMKDNVKMMMMRMNNNIAGIQKNLDALEIEVNGKQDLDIISNRTEAILKHLDDMPKPKPSGMDMPGGKPMMH